MKEVYIRTHLQGLKREVEKVLLGDKLKKGWGTTSGVEGNKEKTFAGKGIERFSVPRRSKGCCWRLEKEKRSH